MERNPSFLKKKYSDLHVSPEVGSATKRTETRAKIKNKTVVESGQAGPLLQEELSTKPDARIQNYLDRFKEIIERPEVDKHERGIEAIKTVLHKKYIIDSKTASEHYIKRQKKIAHEQGHGELDVPTSLEREIKKAVKQVLSGEDAENVLQNFPNEQKQFVEEIVALVEEQKGSLDRWVDYLSSSDATYPDWLKYWGIRNIVGLSKYDKDKKVFPKRTSITANPFPDLNREALAYVLDAIEKKYDGKNYNLDQLEAEDREQVEKLLASENFAKLYAWAIERLTPASAELLAVTDGKWTKYEQGSDTMPLVRSLQGHATGWCTAGESVAKSQLSRGDFHVYYSLDEQGKPTIPRAAIRMEGRAIVEVRGIAPEQNLDAYIAPVVGEKLKDFSDGKVYKKKADDMKQLTAIENKVRLSKELTKDDLVFLYEINSSIEGFGYERDPRIVELRKNRDHKADAPIIFGCEPQDIAWNKNEIGDTTKAYIGPLFPGIFLRAHLPEHLYISFPERKIMQETLIVGGKTVEQYKMELVNKDGFISDYAGNMMSHKDFSLQEKLEEQKFVCLTIKDLGFQEGLYNQIYQKVEELGLDLCSPEIGPAYRLAYDDQPQDETVYIGMKAIPGNRGRSFIFSVYHGDGGLWLGVESASSADSWNLEDKFMFRIKK